MKRTLARARIRAILPVVTAAIVSQSLAGQTPDTAGAVAALAEFEAACQRAEALWPVPLCGPVVLVDPATRLAVANRLDPDSTFEPRHAAWVGSWPEGMPVANTAIQWGDAWWAMAMLPLRGDFFGRLRLLAHESFHRIQPALGHDVSDPMATHLDEEEGRVWLRLELRALARALEAEDDEARAATRDALLFRQLRHRLFPGAAEVERQLEAHEGLAEYTGVRFALDATGEPVARAASLVARFEDTPTYVRSLGYGTGPALGLLLDRLAPGWRLDVGTRPDLATFLAAATGAPATLPDEAADDAYVLRRAHAYDLQTVRAEEWQRANRMAGLRDRYHRELVEGPVLNLELPEGRLMFNPNTVLSLGEHGNVYPGAILLGPWGRLTLHDGAALAPEVRYRARVVAPDVLEPGDDGVLAGPGWTLELEPGWRLVPGPRSGDVELQPPASR